MNTTNVDRAFGVPSAVAVPVPVEMESRPSVAQQAVARAVASFADDYGDATMTILHDATADGGKPYRHLSFASGSHPFFHFEVMTWPGHLAVSALGGHFVFERLPDMMDFFRGESINPHYWAQKCVAGRVSESFNEDVYREVIEAELAALDDSWRPKSEREQIAEAIETDLLGYIPEHVYEAYERVGDFEVTFENSGESFNFYDTGDMDFGLWSHEFLMSCAAAHFAATVYRKTYPERVIPEVA